MAGMGDKTHLKQNVFSNSNNYYKFCFCCNCRIRASWKSQIRLCRATDTAQAMAEGLKGGLPSLLTSSIKGEQEKTRAEASKEARNVEGGGH
jgi:hypothetical protein